MAAKFGFKRITIRILDGESPTVGENLFVLEGKTDKGATQTAKISGLSSEPVKTYGSDTAYYTSRKGVGNVAVDLGLLDMPDSTENAILGYTNSEGITLIGDDTEAPYCSILIESTTSSGKICAYGFFKGSFSKNDEELKTQEDKRDNLPTENFGFTAESSSKEEYKGYYVGKVFNVDDAGLNKLKKALDMQVGA